MRKSCEDKYLKPIAMDIFTKLKRDIEKSYINEELINECEKIMKKLIKDKKGGESMVEIGVYCRDENRLKEAFETFYEIDIFEYGYKVSNVRFNHSYQNSKGEKYKFLIGNESCRAYKFDKIFVDRKIDEDIREILYFTLKPNVEINDNNIILM